MLSLNNIEVAYDSVFLAVKSISINVPEGGLVALLGANGAVEIGGFAVNEMKVWQFTDQRADDAEMLTRMREAPPNVYGFGHQAYYQHVVDCLVHQRGALVDGLEGRKSLELISALYESIETGQEVALHFAPKLCRLGVTP